MNLREGRCRSRGKLGAMIDPDNRPSDEILEDSRQKIAHTITRVFTAWYSWGFTAGLIDYPSGNISNGVAVKCPVKIFCDISNVWCREDIIKLAERVLERQWLLIEHIKRSSRNPARSQRRDQRGLIDDRTSRRID